MKIVVCPNKKCEICVLETLLQQQESDLSSVVLQNKENLEKFLESEEKYSRLVNVIPDGLLIGAGGKIIFANTAAARMVGVESAEELIGAGTLDFVCAEDRERVAAELAYLAEANVLRLASEVQLIHRDGSLVDVEVSATPFIYCGAPAELVVARDVTLRKKLEKQLLHSARLDGIGILAGGIAHDFNNLLTIILGNLSIAKLYAQGDAVQGKLTEIENAAFLAKELSTQLLSLSKGRQLVKTTAELPELLKEMVSFALRGTNVIPSFSFPEKLPLTDVDTAQFSQVINNLVINAMQAMPDGGDLKVSASPVKVNYSRLYHIPLEPGDYVMISVADEGCGIPRENLEKIFDPFYTTKTGGNGLGLTTTFHIVKNHGGHITVESEPGKGTIFSIYLPVAEGLNRVCTQNRQEIAFGHGRVLLMDDDKAVRATTGEMLTLLGYDVEVANCGEDVLKKLQMAGGAEKAGQKYDIFILDKTVRGGMGGLKTMQILKELDPGVKAVLSSGHAEAASSTELADLGFCAFISKPYNLESLSKILKQCLQGT